MIHPLRYFGGIDDRVVSPSIMDNSFILESAMDALGSGEATPDVVSMASSYTHSMIYEILENAKDMLIKLIQQVLSVINNYYLNNIKIMDKYREFILDRVPANGPIIVHQTYEYPDAKDFPKAVRSTAYGDRDIVKLHEDILGGNSDSISVQYRVDKLLESFGKDILDAQIDPTDLKDSTAEAVRRRMRGDEIMIRLDRKTLVTYLDQISTYKKDKDDIQRTKKNVIEDYEMLKRTYAKVTKDPKTYIENRVRGMSEPERQTMLSHEYQRFASIHMEMIRLFNGFITIYQTAFDTKLEEIQRKVEDRRNVINEVITRTGLFTTLNPKNVDPYKTPIKYTPIKT